MNVGTPARQWSWLIAIVFTIFLVPKVATQYMPNTWLRGDGGFYLNMQKSLTRYSTLNQSRLHPHTWYFDKKDVNDAFSNIALGSDGEWWPKHSYIMPIVALPFYWLMGVPGTLVFNIVTILGMIILSYHLARELFDPGSAAAATLAIAFAGPFTGYGYNFSNDGFQTVLILAALLATIRKQWGIGGVIFGIAIWAKITTALVSPMFLAAILYNRGDIRTCVKFAIGASIPITLFGLANWYMFGAPWVTSYQRVLVVKGGQLTTASHTNLFSVPFWDGLKKILVAEHHGLLTGYPLCFVAWLGFIPLLRKRATRLFSVFLIATLISLIVFYSPFRYYQERFLFPWFCLSVIPGAAFVQSFAAFTSRVHVRTRMQVLAVFALLAVLSAIRIASVSFGTENRLSNRIESAQVYLGTDRCDYFNNIRWSWECTGKDRNDAEYIGVNANQQHTVGGQDIKDYVFVRGHHTRKPRRVVFPNVELGDQLTLRYGLDDRSKPPYKTQLIINVGGEEVHNTVLKEKGTMFETDIDTSSVNKEHGDIVITIVSRERANSRLILDGWIK